MSGHGKYPFTLEGSTFDPPDQGSSPEEWRHWSDSLPISAALGLVCKQIGDGLGVFRIEQVPLDLPNPNGSIHGGLLLAAADQCMGAVAMTVLGPGLLPVTASIHSQYHRPAMVPATFNAQVTKRGRALIFVDVDVTDAEGRLCNRSQGTMMTMEHGPA